MSKDFWKSFRIFGRVYLSGLAILSLLLAIFFVVYVSKDFARLPLGQRAIMIVVLLGYSCCAIVIYLLTAVVFRLGREFVRIAFMMAVLTANSVLLTVIKSSHGTPCMSGPTSPCTLNLAVLGVSWSTTGLAIIYATAFAVVTFHAGPYTASVSDREIRDLPTPSIRGLRRESAAYTSSEGQLAHFDEKQRPFSLSKPPSLRDSQNEWPPSSLGMDRNLSPRAVAHYARMGLLVMANLGSSDNASDNGALLDRPSSRFSHARTQSSSAMSESPSLPLGLPPAVSPAPSVRRVPHAPLYFMIERKATIPDVPPSRCSSIYSNNSSASAVMPPSGYGPSAPRLVSSPTLDTSNNDATRPLRAPQLTHYHPRPIDRRERIIRSHPDSTPGFSSLSPGPVSPVDTTDVRVGTTYTGHTQLKSPDRSFRSISPSVHTELTPVQAGEMKLFPVSLIPGGSQRTVHFTMETNPTKTL